MFLFYMLYYAILGNSTYGMGYMVKLSLRNYKSYFKLNEFPGELERAVIL